MVVVEAKNKLAFEWKKKKKEKIKQVYKKDYEFFARAIVLRLY